MKILDIKEHIIKKDNTIIKKYIKTSSYYNRFIIKSLINNRTTYTKVLTYDNNFIGYYDITRFVSCIMFVFIYIDPEYRNSGYGKLLLKDIKLDDKYNILVLNRHIDYTISLLSFLYSNRFKLFDPLDLNQEESFAYGKVCINKL